MSSVSSAAEELDALVEGRTLCGDFLATARTLASSVALRRRREDGSWDEWTYERYADAVARVAAGLRAFGVGRGDRVVLMMRNRPEFHVADVATLFLGATPISIFNSSSPEQIRYLVGHSGAGLAIVEDQGFLDRFRAVGDSLPQLGHTVVIEASEGLAHDESSWEDLMGGEPLDLEAEVTHAAPDDLATVIYTSGTTGNPKGVMLSHRNVCWTVESNRRAWGSGELAGKRLVSYLPMAHVAERMVSHYEAFIVGFEVTTCPEMTQVADHVRDVRPEIMFGVPRVWEKFHAGIAAALEADPEKQRQLDEAIEAAIPITEAMVDGTVTDEQRETYAFLDAVAFSTLRELTGLDRCELAVTGAAPLHADLIRWFRAVGIPLTEVYGLSECSGPMCCSFWAPRAGTVGPPMPGVEVTIDTDGEVCCRGGNVFLGYLDDPDKTAEALDEQGWLHSGDIGEIDEDGYVRIIDRKKELIITAQGKNVSPANLESAMKLIPLVGQAAAVGDRRPYVAALLVLDPDVAPAWATQQGIDFAGLDDLAAHPSVLDQVGRDLDEVMATFNNAERVKRFTLLGDEWVTDSDVLTPTAKLKRRGIEQRYAAEIEALYT